MELLLAGAVIGLGVAWLWKRAKDAKARRNRGGTPGETLPDPSKQES